MRNEMGGSTCPKRRTLPDDVFISKAKFAGSPLSTLSKAVKCGSR
jgi:hypothetical protein